MTDELVEQVARAINDSVCDDLIEDRDDDWQEWTNQARVVIPIIAAHERARIAEWLRNESAVELWQDMDAFEPDTQEELDTIVSVLEAYACAIEKGI